MTCRKIAIYQLLISDFGAHFLCAYAYLKTMMMSTFHTGYIPVWLEVGSEKMSWLFFQESEKVSDTEKQEAEKIASWNPN